MQKVENSCIDTSKKPFSIRYYNNGQGNIFFIHRILNIHYGFLQGIVVHGVSNLQDTKENEGLEGEKTRNPGKEKLRKIKEKD